MKLDRKACELIANIENLIGTECFNPNSYDGWNNVEGCEFRYPISIRNSEGVFIKVRTNLNTTALLEQKDLTPEAITYMKYKFGSNELFIGLGIINVLEYLEKRYNIDFNALEKTIKD